MRGFGFGIRMARRRLLSSAPIVPTLNALSLAASSVTENSPTSTVIGGVLGRTTGSTLTLIDTAGNRFALNGTNLVAGATATDFETATLHSVTIRETLTGYATRDSQLTVTVVNVFEQPSLAALSLSATSFAIGTPASGSITGATTGSTIAATGIPSGLTINGAARTFAWSGTGSAATSTVTLTETLADSANSGRTSNVDVTVTAVAAATSTFAMTQLGASRRIYQRTTKTGGGQSAGQGSIPVTISGASGGTVNARCRSIDGANTILQPEWQAATIANGATTATIAGVDARLGWFFLDLKDSSGSWKLGTVPVGMGRLIAVAGQSLMVCMLSRYVDNATSIAVAGASINDNGRVLATNDSTTTASGWQQFIDQANAAGVHNSAGGAELLDRQIARFGVNCGLIGNAKGGSDIGSWQSGQANFTELARVIALAGGAFEAGWWFQGHTPTISPTDGSYIGRTTAIGTFMASFLGLSSITPKPYITTMPNQTDTSGTNAGFPGGRGNWNVVYQVNRADAEWCANNSGVGVPFSDLTLTDNTHPDQLSARRQANHFDRATAVESGGANDSGPVVTAMTKSGVNLACTVAQQSGGTSLTATGAPANRMRVTQTNNNALTPLALDPTTPLTIDSATQFTLKLASDPGDVPIELWPMGLHLTDAGAANVIRDNVTGGFGEGRQLRYAPVPVLRKSGAGALSTSGISFAAGKFGNGRSNGEMKTAAKLLPSWPWDGCALEFWFTYSGSVVTGTTALVVQAGTIGVYLDASGNLLLNVGGTLSATIAAGITVGSTPRHIRTEFAPLQSKQWTYVDGTPIGSPLTTAAGVGTSNVLAVGGNGSGGALLGSKGVIDEVAYWNRQLTKGASFTPPTSPYTDGDPNGPAFLWHLNGDGAESGWAA